MDSHENRRAQLRKWVEKNGTPPKEKSYFSQLTGGIASFGEKAARRLEKDYGMGVGYLDRTEDAREASVKHISASTDKSKKRQNQGMIEASPTGIARTVELLTRHVGDSPNFRRIYVVGKAQGGLPERIWTDGDHLVGAIDEYAELATPDPQAFICPVVGDSMYPRYMPGEYVLVEPNTPPRVGGTVLVRLATGETMLKKLDHRANGHVHLSSWNDPVQHTFREEDISWIYYVAHMVPPEKIKMRF